MTLEKAIEFGKIFLKTIEDEKGSATYEFVETAIKALEQEQKLTRMIDKSDFSQEQYSTDIQSAYDCGKSVLDKIRAEIQDLRNCSCSCSDGIIDDVEDIIDKYKADRSDDYAD